MVVDRYDLYLPYGLEVMNKNKDGMTILVDCKQGIPSRGVGIALIDLLPEKVTVFA